ncbi:MAG: hypothetical protein COZ46_07530 [Verrucomicrobia bacterium CG_4_10_14_3_um_filter_43_23]|nr:MAG: hypothetical protein AUJ82_03175 [Verrucomicrobia bacterium CG1_02_43_26]PIP59697.1 MAG: hypothetical protein COX01_02005 [Verrucomicrobia bacterium CG22_combo_CG10-13_8_21_14_all_43_17]PIX57709.1 MAG: hypothetical protein COZ46_07530 [Verrucomicrobia bacterium CG_4_10_14_3_um_filter_43_23]PIY62501.1 MAG: hypothetical protein COY94_01715 [Verrucomicrobia bacterium CG_4_10_14_0_8_um_filter_43_34]PJA44679.1 MAG: hypothetical protein CO175_01910 [Verrucomicrobia bacterium CG_4_9_14_3_um_fi
MPGENKERTNAADAYFSAADMLFVFDEDSRYKFANSRAESYLGTDIGNILGKKARELLGDEEDAISKHVKRAICSQQSIHTLQKIKVRGEDKVFDIVLAPIRDIETKGTNVYGIFRDVTEYSKGQEISAIDGWQDVLENLPTAVFQIMEMDDGKPMVSYVGSEFHRIMGHKTEVGAKDIYKIWNRVNSSDIDRVKNVVKCSIQEGKGWNVTYRVRKKDGGERFVKEMVSAEKTQIGRGRIWTGVIMDITEMQAPTTINIEGKKTEQTNPLDLSWEADEQWKFIKIGEAASAILGYSSNDIKGKKLFDLADNENSENIKKRLKRVQQERRAFSNYTFNLLSKEGSAVIVTVSGKPRHAGESADIAGYQGTLEDVTKQVSGKQYAKEEIDYLKDIIDLSPVATYACHPMNELAMTRVSQNVEKILGHRAEDFLADPLFALKLVHSEDQPVFLEKVSELMHSEDSTYACEYRFKDNTGGYLRVRDEMHLIKDPYGKIYEIIGYLMNVEPIADKEQASEFSKSSPRNLESALEESNNRLEESMIYAQHMAQEAELANAAKTNFLTNISHEIRTPMNAIMGIASILGDTSLTLEQKDYVHTILNSSEALLEIVNDLLDFAKIEAGKIKLEDIQYDLVTCIEDSIDLFSVKAAEKEIELIYEIDEAVPTRLRGDPSRLRQVIINLISNALKFTPEGEVCIKVGLDKYDGQDATLKFSIRDTRIGIQEDAHEHLFKAFSQADESTNRKHGGSGLGLTICRKLLKMMGGEIWFTSKEGKGTTFFFTMRTKLGDPVSNEENQLQSTLLKEKEILIVDSNRCSAASLSTSLRGWGANTHSVQDSEACLTKAKQLARCHLIIIKDSGRKTYLLDLIDQLKSNSITEHIPIIITHPKHKKETRESCQHILNIAFLGTPIRKTPLLSVIADVLTLRKKGHTRGLNPYSFQAHRTEPNDMRVLTVEDNKVNQKVTLLTLEKLGYHIEAASNGLDAINMVQSASYDIIFMDMYMPQMDGLETTRWIRSNLGNRKQPYIIAMTAAASTEDVQKCIEAGLDDYISKPFRVEDVVKALQNFRLKTKGLDSASKAPLPA